MDVLEQLWEEGSMDGRRKLLLKLLGSRFGVLPEAAVARVEAASLAQFKVWIDRVLTAPTLADFLSEEQVLPAGSRGPSDAPPPADIALQAFWADIEHLLGTGFEKERVQIKEGFMMAVEDIRAEGRLEGRNLLFLHLLRARFGWLPDRAVTRVQVASQAQVDAWAERLLTAPTFVSVIDEV